MPPVEKTVKRLAKDVHETGTHRVCLNGASLPSGTYVVRLRGGTTKKTQRITMVK